MRWLQSEYLLKGIFLGLLLFVALQEPDWRATGQVALFTLGGLVLALGVAAYSKLREGYHIKGRVLAFVLFLLLESPGLVYAGILFGMALGALSIRTEQTPELLFAVGGGAVLGLLFWLLRLAQNRWTRLGLSLALAAALAGGFIYWFQTHPDFLHDPTLFGIHLLLGIPVFYLLTFAGLAEETEVEIGAICAALGLGLWMLHRVISFQALAIVVPLAVYYLYTTRVLPGLRVFKHVIRGHSFASVGRYARALQAFRRALEFDPGNRMAREGLWKVHRALDLAQVVHDKELLALIDLDLCLHRVSALLLAAGPAPAKLEEAHRLLDLVLSQRPAMQPTVDYWRAVAHTHERRYDEAAALLEGVLDGSRHTPNNPYRRAVLLPAWQLALTLHPELKQRVGTPQLALPGRRMEAIAAVERHLADHTNDEAVWGLKRLLYQDLTEAEYEVGAGERGRVSAPSAAADFDHEYVQQMGLALINDPVRWQRGAEFLRMAVRGLPEQGPTLYGQIAQAHHRAGDADGTWHTYELAKRAGRAVGPKNLGDADRQAYFATVKLLAETAQGRGDIDAALENWHLYTENERSGLETLRILADLYEQKGDALAALRATEQALVYDAKDKDLLGRKDKYYYSVMPDDLRARLDLVAPGFDVGYCLRKARSLLDLKDGDLDLVDWALHLAELAQVVQPASQAAKLLRARAHLRRGEKDEAVVLLEDVHSNRPERFASAEDEDGWYLSCRLLGELYLYELGKPDLAVPCFNDFRKSSKSGADTLYKLGQAYEQLGDRVRAAKCYENVTAYEGHPRAYEAQEALDRLKYS